MEIEDIFSDTLELFGEKQIEDDGLIHYGPLKLSVAPKEGKAISKLANALFSPSLVIAEQIETGLIPVQGRSIVELGAGCAVPSLVAAALSPDLPPSVVVVTDYPDKLILDNLKQNVVDARAHARCSIHCIGYEWGADPQPLLEPLSRSRSGYDIVILSDLLYFDSCHDVLVSSVTNLLSKSKDSKAYIAAGKYTPSHVCDNFIQLAKAAGIIMEEEYIKQGWEGKVEVKGGGLESAEDLSYRKGLCRMWTGRWV